MSADLETELREAFAARASLSTTSPDAWARINRRVVRSDHRRSVVLRSVAAAAIVVLVVGGGVALFRNGGRDVGTVATKGGASKSVAEDSAASAAGGAFETAPAAPFVLAGNGLEVQQNADGTIVARLGSTTTAPVQAGGTSAAIDGTTVFGVVPVDAAIVTVARSTATGEILGGSAPFFVAGVPTVEFFIATTSAVPVTEDVVVTAWYADVQSERDRLGTVVARRQG